MRRRASRLLAAVALTVLCAVLAGCGTGQQGMDMKMSGDDDGYFGAVLDDQYTAPDVSLTDDSGQPFDLRSDTTKPLTLVFFGYTNCPDICQVVMATLASALTMLDEDRRDDVQVLFITTDPARDDAKTLHTWVDRFDPSFVGLTGDLEDIKAVGDSMGVFIEKGDKLPTGGYDVNHSTQVVAIDAADRSPIVWTGGTSAAEFASDLDHLLQHPLEDK